MTKKEHSTVDPDINTSSDEESATQGHQHIFDEPQDGAKDILEEAAQEVVAEESIEDLKAEVQAMKDQWLRSEAENQNLRNRHKKELEDTRLYTVQKFARDVVEAAENLRRGIDSLPKAIENEDPIITKMREGFESTERSFLQILEKNGIQSEDPTGAPFDANKHQAMAEQPSDEHPSGTVMQSWTPTWTLNNRLLKPAMVIVAKATEKSE